MYKEMIVAALGVGCVFGQITTKSIGGQEFGPIGISVALAGPIPTVAGAPYSADTVTQRVQTLADGNRIEQTTAGSVARDGQGRVMRQQNLPGFQNSADAPALITIDDPVANLVWVLDSKIKMATKTIPMKNVNFGPFGGATVSVAGAAPAYPPSGPKPQYFMVDKLAAEHVSGAVTVSDGGMMGPVTAGMAGPGLTANATKTDLGSKMINGLMAQGVRMTRTLAAGEVGNSQPIVITTETWMSPELHVMVMSKSVDPRMGETTFELTNIQRSEPPASLFQVPSDYTVRDSPSEHLMIQAPTKNPE